MMRVAAIVGLAMLAVAPQLRAAGETSAVCSIYVDDQWSELGSGVLASCLKGMDNWVPAYNAQGFKFGAWGNSTLLAADRYYFYRSDDVGQHWRALGLKTELVPQTDAAADLPAPVAQERLQTLASDSEVPAEVPAATAPARRHVTHAERRNCSLHTADGWDLRRNQTIDECARRLDRSPDVYDANGFKYAYWSGTFLAANAEEVLRSDDSRDWQTVMPRSSPR